MSIYYIMFFIETKILMNINKIFVKYASRKNEYFVSVLNSLVTTFIWLIILVTRAFINKYIITTAGLFLVSIKIISVVCFYALHVYKLLSASSFLGW